MCLNMSRSFNTLIPSSYPIPRWRPKILVASCANTFWNGSRNMIKIITLVDFFHEVRNINYNSRLLSIINRWCLNGLTLFYMKKWCVWEVSGSHYQHHRHVKHKRYLRFSNTFDVVNVKDLYTSYTTDEYLQSRWAYGGRRIKLSVKMTLRFLLTFCQIQTKLKR